VRGLKFGSAAIGHVGYAAACLAAGGLLLVGGYAHKTVGELRSLGADGIGIAGSPSVGAMNILVMGLESRTNFEGQTLSAQQLTETHSGSVSGINSLGYGAQDTDTLILIHIFAGGRKAVGFSIPRDDVVNFPHATLDGLTEGKIDAAYDYAYNLYLDDNSGKLSGNALYQGANEAGQLFEIQTVESVTGVHIDHFVESDIIGFYYLAQQFRGMEVCIKPAPAQGGFPASANLTDLDTLANPPTDNSGFNAYEDGYNRKKGGAQYLFLSPPQALAFVRSRDTLPGVDIGRTALRDLQAEERGSAERPQHDHHDADHRQELPDHRQHLGPARLRDRHERAHRQEPLLHHPRLGAHQQRAGARLHVSAERELHRRAVHPARRQ
jgi:anionic cell wall polymer biosynthesis LytR-Cps2A-Psr (LCP) family protein